MTQDQDAQPILLGWLRDPSRELRSFAPDAIYERLFEEVFGNPDTTRSHVTTLHLYVEYWLDRILDKLGISPCRTFHNKIDELQKLGILENSFAQNLDAINKLRNIYAHELDLASANVRVRVLIGQLSVDPYFHSTDPDPLRCICIQVMFLLEATYHNDCKPPKLPEFPHHEAKARLEAEGKLHWQHCEILSRKDQGNVERYVLRCPFCKKGSIIRERDCAPGFKDAFMSVCQECGLTGNGYDFDLHTVTKRGDAV